MCRFTGNFVKNHFLVESKIAFFGPFWSVLDRLMSILGLYMLRRAFGTKYRPNWTLPDHFRGLVSFFFRFVHQKYDNYRCGAVIKQDMVLPFRLPRRFQAVLWTAWFLAPIPSSSLNCLKFVSFNSLLLLLT